MKMTRVLLYNDYTPDPLELSFQDPSSENPYRILSIVGLDADDVMWGDNEAKLRKGQIVVQLGLSPNWREEETYSTLRDQLFRMIQATRSGAISLGFADGESIVATISGRVVKMEAVTFSKTPDMKLTIDCKDRMLRSPELFEVNVVGLDPSSTTIDDQLSTAPHGVLLAVKFNAPTATFTISGDDGWEFKSTPVGIGGFQVDDVLTCSSLFNAKSLILTRDDEDIPIADSILAGSVWPIIFPRPNVIECSGDVDWEAIKYSTAYWGI